MAMLAEPRQRRRYTLAPRGKALYEDENRFGTKMLEKMGWKKGEGLGANADGSKDFVRIRYKNDAFGVGFEQRDDQWTQHEQSFNGLLKTLNYGENGELKSKKENDVSEEGTQLHVDVSVNDITKPTFEKIKAQISGVSLEQKSKQSKARVHYKKFTKGKDIAQYSEKELANIFGKRAVNEENNDVNDIYQNGKAFVKSTENFCGVQLEDTFIINAEIKRITDRGTDAKNVTEEQKEKEQKDNQQLINSNVSVNDYFKIKMENRKRKSYSNINNISSYNEVNEEYDAQQKKKKDTQNIKNISMLDSVEKNFKKISIQQCYKHNENDSEEKKLIEFDGCASEKLSLNKIKKKKAKLQNHIQIETSNENSLTKKIDRSLMDAFAKMDSTSKRTKKEKNCNNEIIKSSNGAKEEKGTNKSKRNKESIIKISVKDDNLPMVNKPDEISDHSSKKPPKVERKNEIASAKNIFISNVNFKLLDLEEIVQKHQEFNIYPISSFSAEKFRNINLNKFAGSVLPQIEGYGLSPELQLDVKINKADEERITNLWGGVFDKYAHLERPLKTYQHYVRKVIAARKIKQKRPKLHVKTWKRKSAFQVL